MLMNVSGKQQIANSFWPENWDRVRENWSVDTSTVFQFNHGSYGAVPNVVREYQRELLARIDKNPSGFFRRELESLLEEARLVAAQYCGADPDSFAWCRNVSEGMTVAINAVPLKPADEILITNQIYPAVRCAVQNRALQTGAEIVEVRIPHTDDDSMISDIIESGITVKTKLLIVDEIPSSTARQFPVRKLASIAKQRGITYIVDGAHAPGMHKLDVRSLDADFWVGNFHKWVCAPHSAAAIVVAPAWRDKIRPSYASYRDRMPFPDVFSRLGTDDQTGILSVPVAIKFLAELGADKVTAYNKALAAYGAEQITKAIGTEKIPGTFCARHPVALPEGVASTPVAAQDLTFQIARDLKAEVSVSPPLLSEAQGALVISAFAYNHPAEFDRFAVLFSGWIQSFRLNSRTTKS
jgi:isopenicillin-N epimerase